MHYIKQRGIILVDDDHGFPVCLRISLPHQVCHPRIRLPTIGRQSIFLLIRLQKPVKVFHKRLRIKMFCTAHVEMKHRMARPLFLIFCNGKPIEQFFITSEIRMKRRGKE